MNQKNGQRPGARGITPKPMPLNTSWRPLHSGLLQIDALKICIWLIFPIVICASSQIFGQCSKTYLPSSEYDPFDKITLITSPRIIFNPTMEMRLTGVDTFSKGCRASFRIETTDSDRPTEISFLLTNERVLTFPLEYVDYSYNPGRYTTYDNIWYLHTVLLREHIKTLSEVEISEMRIVLDRRTYIDRKPKRARLEHIMTYMHCFLQEI